jgi:glycosyltransferase involved in cell wall biosynthesis
MCLVRKAVLRLRSRASASDPESMQAAGPERITMLLENNPYPQDVRVRAEAESLAGAGHRVMVAAPRAAGQPRRERINGVDVIRFRHVDGSHRGAVGFVLEYLVAGLALHLAAMRELLRGSTVLHLHNPPDILFPAGALYRLAGRKAIFDHHDLFPETVQVKLGSRLAARLAAGCQRMTFAVANHVVATNESYAAVARVAGHKRPDQITVVRNGPPAAWTRMPVQQAQGVLARVHLVYLGAISSQDGVEGLAPVLARLRYCDDPIDARLTVIGDGDGRPALERAFAAHGVLDLVTFTGRVAAARVPGLLADADICVDPAPATDVNERSTMTKLAEYLALGKPVVAYDLLEARRTAAGAAVLVERGNVDAFAEAILQLARDPPMRMRMADKARRRATALTWEHSERALLGAYEGLRAGRNAQGQQRSGVSPASRASRVRTRRGG